MSVATVGVRLTKARRNAVDKALGTDMALEAKLIARLYSTPLAELEEPLRALRRAIEEDRARETGYPDLSGWALEGHHT